MLALLDLILRWLGVDALKRVQQLLSIKQKTGAQFADVESKSMVFVARRVSFAGFGLNKCLLGLLTVMERFLLSTSKNNSQNHQRDLWMGLWIARVMCIIAGTDNLMS